MQSIGSGSRLLAVIALVAISMHAPVTFGQNEPGGGARKVTIKQKDAPKSTPILPKAGKDAAAVAKPAAGDAASKPAVAKNPPTGKALAADDAAEAQGSFVDNLVSFIRTHAAWILGTLGLLLGGVLVWAFVVGRGKREKGEDAFAELGLGEKTPKTAAKAAPTRFSSTKIRTADVNSRLSRAVKTTEVETDREYALVVDEEDLKMPPLPEEAGARDSPRGPSSSSSRSGDTAPIQKLLEAKKYKDAYTEYVRQIESNAAASFQGDVERSLAEHLMHAKDLEKASRVLEHHVATRAKTEVKPDVFFNLGYIHFQRKTLSKSRRYLTLFVESEKNPAYIARAKKILARIKTTPAQN